MRVFLGLCLASALGGCATSSGVLKTGPDQYTLSVTRSDAIGGATAAKKAAYVEASDECDKQGRSFELVSEKVLEQAWGDGKRTVDIVFRCAKKA